MFTSGSSGVAELASSVPEMTSSKQMAISFDMSINVGATGSFRLIFQKGSDPSSCEACVFLAPNSNQLEVRFTKNNGNFQEFRTFSELSLNVNYHIELYVYQTYAVIFINGNADAILWISAIKTNNGDLHLGASASYNAMSGRISNFTWQNSAPFAPNGWEIDFPPSGQTDCLPNAVYFNGDSSLRYILPEIHTGNSAVSLYMELTAQSNGAWRTVFQKGDDASEKTLMLQIRPESNRLHVSVSTSSSAEEFSSNADLLLNKNYAIYVVQDGRVISLYVNGILDSQHTCNDDVVQNYGALWIGDSSYSNGLNGFQGNISKLVYYNYPPSVDTRPNTPAGPGCEYVVSTPLSYDGSSWSQFSPPAIDPSTTDQWMSFHLYVSSSSDRCTSHIVQHGASPEERTLSVDLECGGILRAWITDTYSPEFIWSDFELPKNTWVGVVIASSGRNTYIYVDNIMVGSWDAPYPLLNNFGSVFVGGLPWDSSNGLIGRVADLKYCTGSLPAGVVQQRAFTVIMDVEEAYGNNGDWDDDKDDDKDDDDDRDVTIRDYDNNVGGNGMTTIVGSWETATFTTAGRPVLYLHDNKKKKGKLCANFISHLKTYGSYSVWLWHPGKAKSSDKVPVKIHNRYGDITVLYDESVTSNSWDSLGTYDFKSGSDGYVSICNDGTSKKKYVTATSVKFQYEGPSGCNLAVVGACRNGGVPNAACDKCICPIGWEGDICDQQTCTIVMDNHYVPDSAKNGDWQPYACVGNYFDSDADRLCVVDGSSALYQPTVYAPGYYTVKAWWPLNDNSNLPPYASKARFVLTDADGDQQNIIVDQRANGGQWNIIGTLLLNTGVSGSVEIRNDNSSDGCVISDAIMFECGGTPPEPPAESCHLRVEFPTLEGVFTEVFLSESGSKGELQATVGLRSDYSTMDLTKGVEYIVRVSQGNMSVEKSVSCDQDDVTVSGFVASARVSLGCMEHVDIGFFQNAGGNQGPLQRYFPNNAYSVTVVVLAGEYFVEARQGGQNMTHSSSIMPEETDVAFGSERMIIQFPGVTNVDVAIYTSDNGNLGKNVYNEFALSFETSVCLLSGFDYKVAFRHYGGLTVLSNAYNVNSYNGPTIVNDIIAKITVLFHGMSNVNLMLFGANTPGTVALAEAGAVLNAVNEAVFNVMKAQYYINATHGNSLEYSNFVDCTPGDQVIVIPVAYVTLDWSPLEYVASQLAVSPSMELLYTAPPSQAGYSTFVMFVGNTFIPSLTTSTLSVSYDPFTVTGNKTTYYSTTLKLDFIGLEGVSCEFWHVLNGTRTSMFASESNQNNSCGTYVLKGVDYQIVARQGCSIYISEIVENIAGATSLSAELQTLTIPFSGLVDILSVIRGYEKDCRYSCEVQQQVSSDQATFSLFPGMYYWMLQQNAEKRWAPAAVNLTSSSHTAAETTCMLSITYPPSGTTNVELYTVNPGNLPGQLVQSIADTSGNLTLLVLSDQYYVSPLNQTLACGSLSPQTNDLDKCIINIDFPNLSPVEIELREAGSTNVSYSAMGLSNSYSVEVEKESYSATIRYNQQTIVMQNVRCCFQNADVDVKTVGLTFLFPGLSDVSITLFADDFSPVVIGGAVSLNNSYSTTLMQTPHIKANISWNGVIYHTDIEVLGRTSIVVDDLVRNIIFDSSGIQDVSHFMINNWRVPPGYDVPVGAQRYFSVLRGVHDFTVEQGSLELDFPGLDLRVSDVLVKPHVCNVYFEFDGLSLVDVEIFLKDDGIVTTAHGVSNALSLTLFESIYSARLVYQDGQRDEWFETIYCNDTIVVPFKPTDEEILKCFYNESSGDEWTDRSGWFDDPNICNWFGIDCNGKGDIISISLPSNNLKGKVCDQICMFNPPLRVLVLSNNNMQAMPTSFNGCNGLQTLYIDNNNFGGEIAGSLFRDIPHLQYLWLGDNGFTGLIPETIADMKYLMYFYAENNKLSGPLPLSICEMTNLRTIRLQNNMLSGPVPDCLGTFPLLKEVWLQNNQFNGVVPPTLVSTVSLDIFSVASNDMEGCRPAYETGIAYDMQLQGNRWSCETSCGLPYPETCPTVGVEGLSASAKEINCHCDTTVANLVVDGVQQLDRRNPSCSNMCRTSQCPYSCFTSRAFAIKPQSVVVSSETASNAEGWLC